MILLLSGLTALLYPLPMLPYAFTSDILIRDNLDVLV